MGKCFLAFCSAVYFLLEPRPGSVGGCAGHQVSDLYGCRNFLVGGSDTSILLGPGPHFDTHPFGEISGNEGDRVPKWGPWVLGDSSGGTDCTGSNCLQHEVNVDAVGVPHKKSI